jgi:hypothetical protein
LKQSPLLLRIINNEKAIINGCRYIINKYIKLAIITIILLSIISACEIKENRKDDFIIYIDHGKVTIIDYCGDEKELVIPNTINGLPVVYIGKGAFFENKLESVILPDCLESIGRIAFGKNELTNIIIPNSVVSINEEVFFYNKLENITISKTITRITANTFNSNRLTSVTIPDSVRIIDWGSFANNKLTELEIPENVEFIGNRAFANNQLTEVAILSSSVRILYEAFFGNQISSISLGENIDIEDDAFENNFTTFYAAKGKKGGRYTYDNGTWNME